MAEFFIPTINHVETLQDRKIYEVIVTPMEETINVTFTSNRDVAAEWVAMFHPEHRSFFPVGVAVRNDGGEIPHVMTLCTGQECLVLNLPLGNAKNLSRDVKVFLRDVCTCYGWRTDGYEDLIKTTNATLSLGRLTDIQTIVPNGHNMRLGDFSMMAFGRQVPDEPVSIWGQQRSLKKKQIRETVMEAYISQMIGRMNPHLAPTNNSLSRVISDAFPQINIVAELADKKVYQVSVDGNLTLVVTYTNRLSVLTSWLSSLGRLDNQRPGLIGIDKNHNHRGVDTVVGLAFGHECLVFNLYKSKQSSAGSLVPSEVFEVFLDSTCPFIGWHTGDRDGEFFGGIELGLRSERVLDIRSVFPQSYSYADLARLVLGYEMPKLIIVQSEPEENEIMRVAVQAYVCVRGGLQFGYANRQ